MILKNFYTSLSYEPKLNTDIAVCAKEKRYRRKVQKLVSKNVHRNKFYMSHL